MLNTQHLGAYVLTEQLRQDRTGTVYRGEHVTTNDPVTIKILDERYGTHPDLVARFHRAVEALRRIDHPGIARVLDHGESPQGLYLVTESLTGELLAERLHREQRLPLEETQRIVGAIASALAAAHRERVVHRDLSADSIFLVQAGDDGGPPEVKVLDLGLSKLLGAPSVPSNQDAASRRGFDQRTDIRALGRLAYLMLSGEAPVESSADEAGPGNRRQLPARLSAHGVTVPVAVEAAILRALERKKKRRFSSMTEFASALGVDIAPAGGSSAESEVVLPLDESDLALIESPKPPPLPPPQPASSLSARMREAGRRTLRRPKVAAMAAAAVAVLALGAMTIRRGDQPSTVAVESRSPAPTSPVEAARAVDVARVAPTPSAPTRVDEILALNQQAVGAYQQGDLKGARGLLLRADKLAIASGYQDAPVRAQTQVRLGALFVAQKKPRLGRPYLVKAVAINPAVRIPPEMMSPQVHKTLIATKQKARVAKSNPPKRGLKSQPTRRHGRDLRKR